MINHLLTTLPFITTYITNHKKTYTSPYFKIALLTQFFLKIIVRLKIITTFADKIEVFIFFYKIMEITNQSRVVENIIAIYNIATQRFTPPL